MTSIAAIMLNATTTFLIACSPRVAPEYPIAPRDSLSERVGWHRALGDPSWAWPQEPGASFTVGTPLDPIAPPSQVEFGVDPAHAELMETHRPLPTWRRPVRAAW